MQMQQQLLVLLNFCRWQGSSRQWSRWLRVELRTRSEKSYHFTRHCRTALVIDSLLLWSRRIVQSSFQAFLPLVCMRLLCDSMADSVLTERTMEMRWGLGVEKVNISRNTAALLWWLILYCFDHDALCNHSSKHFSFLFEGEGSISGWWLKKWSICRNCNKQRLDDD